jgi:hypothetical protein
MRFCGALSPESLRPGFNPRKQPTSRLFRNRCGSSIVRTYVSAICVPTPLRFLLVEAAQAAARINPDWRRRYIHLAIRRHKSIAKVALGRRLGVRLYWMWRNSCEYSPSMEFGSYAGQLGIGHGVN